MQAKPSGPEIHLEVDAEGFMRVNDAPTGFMLIAIRLTSGRAACSTSARPSARRSLSPSQSYPVPSLAGFRYSWNVIELN
jgi:hypothetical protein